MPSMLRDQFPCLQTVSKLNGPKLKGSLFSVNVQNQINKINRAPTNYQ